MAKFKEQLAYDSFASGCLGLLRLERIENMVGEAMPDVLGVNRGGTVFWLELKALHEWPKRATTCPLKSKFEKGQLGFLCSWRSGWDGHAFVLLRVDKVYYLIKPRMDLSELNQIQLMENSVAIGKRECIEYLEKL